MLPIPKEASRQKQENRTCQACAQFLTALPFSQAVLQIIHGAAGPFILAVFPPIQDTQDILGVVGHHAKERDEPHPKYRARSADRDGSRHTDDIAGTDRSRQCCTQGLELGDAAILRVPCDIPVAENGSDRILQPVPQMGQLEKSSHTGHQHSRKAQQNQCGPAPYHIIDCTIYIGNHFNHRLFLLTRANFPKFHIQERLLLGRPFYITGIFRYIKNGDSLYPTVSVDIPLFYFLRDFLYLIIEDAGGSSYFFCIFREFIV